MCEVEKQKRRRRLQSAETVPWHSRMRVLSDGQKPSSEVWRLGQLKIRYEAFAWEVGGGCEHCASLDETLSRIECPAQVPSPPPHHGWAFVTLQSLQATRVLATAQCIRSSATLAIPYLVQLKPRTARALRDPTASRNPEDEHPYRHPRMG